MKILYLFILNLLTASITYCLTVKPICTLAHPSNCFLKYRLTQLEKHQIEDAIKFWSGKESIVSEKFKKEFDKHPLISLFIKGQEEISSKSDSVKPFTVDNLKNLTVNNLSL